MELYKLPHGGDDLDNMFKHLPIPQPSFRCALIGPSGSGKTYLMMQFVLNPKWYFKNNKTYWKGGIFIFSPTILGDPIYKNLLDPSIKEKVFASDKLNQDKIHELLDDVGDKDPKLIIIDDFAAHLKGKAEKIINDIFFRSRHNNASILLLSQNYKSLPKPCRLNLTDLFIFNFSNQKELKLIEEEQANKSLNGHEFIDALCECTDIPYGFMYKNKSGHFLNSKFLKII